MFLWSRSPNLNSNPAQRKNVKKYFELGKPEMFKNLNTNSINATYTPGAGAGARVQNRSRPKTYRLHNTVVYCVVLFVLYLRIILGQQVLMKETTFLHFVRALYCLCMYEGLSLTPWVGFICSYSGLLYRRWTGGRPTAAAWFPSIPDCLYSIHMQQARHAAWPG